MRKIARKDEPVNPDVIDLNSTNDSLCVRWEGAFLRHHSLSIVNTEIALRLAREPGLDLTIGPVEPAEFGPASDPRLTAIVERTFKPLSRPADIHVRHFYPPLLTPPVEGKLVAMHPWEYGFLPVNWIAYLKDTVDEIWCYSEYVRQVYIASGIPAKKLVLIPLGVDTNVFRPDAPPYVFTTEPGASRVAEMDEPPFVFLFCGGSIDRKGIDLLEKAYIQTFAPGEPVVLVIKDTGTKTVYRGGNAGERFRTLALDETRPAIIYIDEDLPATVLAGLYTAADVTVLPYRAEGFCLPALESMNCCRPVIVTKGGPTDDFVDDAVGWQIEAKRVPHGGGRIGEWLCCGETWWFEPDVKALGKAMRRAYSQRELCRELGLRGAEHIRSSYTWSHTVEKAVARMLALRDNGLPPLSSTTRDALPITVKKASKAKPNLSVVSGGKPSKGGPVLAKAVRRKRPTIGVYLIVKNEERVIEECLNSIVACGAFDEIIIVDTGSTDRTIEIIQSFPSVKLGYFQWCNSFSAARNYAFSLASEKADWLYWMDADDTITPESGAKMRESVMLAESKTMGILMQVQIPPPPGEHGFTVVDHLKLIRNVREGAPGKSRPLFQFSSRIHEQILDSINQHGGGVERSDAYVTHSGYDYSTEGQLGKQRRDMPLLLLDESENPTHPMPKWNLGMTHFHLKHFDEAIVKLEECLALSKPQESIVHKAYAMLGGACVELRDFDRARSYLDTGLTLFPDDTELLFRSANLYRELGDFNAAEVFFRRLLGPRRGGGVDSLDITMAGNKGLHNYAGLLMEMNRFEEAESCYKKALEIAPKFLPSLQMLGSVYIQMRRFEDARAVQRRIAELDPNIAGALGSVIDGISGSGPH